MIRWTAALLAALLLLSGCTSLAESDDISNLPPLTPRATEEAAERRTVNAALYFPDSQTSKLSAEMREIQVGAGEDPGRLILSALLKGPREPSLNSLGSGVTLQNLEITDEVANVYLGTQPEMGEEARFVLSAAITDTLTDYFSVKYVCVYIDGNVLTVGGAPCGPLVKSDSSLSALYSQYLAKYAPPGAGEAEMNVVLYFADPSGRYMLPEVRKITFENGNYIEKTFEQLSLGPSYKYYLQGMVGRDFVADQLMRIVDTGMQGRQYFLFAEDPFPAAREETARVLAMSSVYYTLAGLLPDMERLTFEIGGSPKVITREIAEAYLGQSIAIYLPNMDLTSLNAVSRTVQAGRSGSLETYMEELIRGPIDVDKEDIWPAFPEEITMDDVRGIEVKGSMAVVNFSDNFMIQMEKMSDKKRVLLIYSVVNTLAGVGSIKTVQFLIEGEKVEGVGGHLDLHSPFMPNPGIAR